MRRITELRRVPNAIPFARYSTRLHRGARAQWTPYANENENGRRLRTSGQMLRLTRIVLPLPYRSPSCFLSFPTPPISPLPPPPHCPSSAQPSRKKERERPAIETSIMLYLRLANVTLAPDGTQFPCTKGNEWDISRRGT